MFGFFKKRPPVVPPTDKQRKYAARLGIDVTDNMSKSDVSGAIAEAERKNQRAAPKGERDKAKKREPRCNQEIIGQESYWNRFAETLSTC